MTTPISRLTAFRDHIIATESAMNTYRFEQKCGLSNGYFKSNASCNNERGVSSESIAKVKRAYPQLNVEWVVIGTGSMLITPAGIPFYPTPFYTLQPEAEPSQHISIPSITSPGTFACLSTEQAMLPTIPINSTIILSPSSSLTTAHLSRPVAIILNDGSRLIRHLAAITTKTLTLAPATASDIYLPITIPWNTVTHIFQVLSVITHFTTIIQ